MFSVLLARAQELSGVMPLSSFIFLSPLFLHAPNHGSKHRKSQPIGANLTTSGQSGLMQTNVSRPIRVCRTSRLQWNEQVPSRILHRFFSFCKWFAGAPLRRQSFLLAVLSTRPDSIRSRIDSRLIFVRAYSQP